MGCGVTCLRTTLTVFNILTLLVGGALVGIGIGALVLGTQLSIVLHQTGLSIGFIVLGGLIILITLIGCIGLTRDSQALLITYTALLVVTMALTLGVGITALVYRDSAGDLVITGWDLADQATRENIEASFICCGLRSTSEEPTCPVHTPDVAPCFDKLVGALHEPLLIVGITGVVLGAVQQCVLIGICIIGTKRHHERE